MNKSFNKTYEEDILFQKIGILLNSSRENLSRVINQRIVLTYYQIGKLITNNEQKGNLRAEYAGRTLFNLSNKLTKKFGKGFTVRNLELMRQFYKEYSKSKSLISESINLSWTHYINLIRIKDEKERFFYEVESIKNNWSVRELNRQIKSFTYKRLTPNTKKTDNDSISINNIVSRNVADNIKQAYVLEFLGLKDNLLYSEGDLEEAIINNLQNFLLELGNGFTFVSRQQKISLSSKYFYIDLVFYNRFLKSFILIDLKIGQLKHQDLGQMQMYVNYYDREIKNSRENKTIGIVLCKQKDDTIVKYTLPENNHQIYAREYKLYLPKEDEFRNLLNNN